MSKYAAIPSFSEIIAQIGEALWVVGPTGFWVYVNPTFARFIGIRDDEVYSHPLFDYIHPDDKEECARMFDTLKSGSDIAEFRYRLVHRDGMDVWVSSVVTAVKDAGRQVQYYVGTSRKVSAEKLELSREPADGVSQVALPGAPEIPFESVVELMTDPVWVIDTSRLCVFTNPAFNLMVGYSAEELIGKNISELIEISKRPDVDNAVKQLIEGEEVTEASIIMKHRSGQQVPLTFLIKPVRSVEGGIKFFIGSNRDKGQVLPGTALPDPSAPYRAALERIGVPAWITDSKGSWIFLNAAFCSMLGFKSTDIPAGNLPSIVHPDDQVLIRNAFSDLGKTDSVSLTCRVQPGNGKLHWMSMSLNAIRLENDGLTYILSAGFDLTNERHLETRLSQATSRIQDFANLMDEAVLAVDQYGKIRLINDKVTDLLDRMDFEILEQDLVDLFPPTYATLVGSMLKKASEGGTNTELVGVDTSEGECKLIIKCSPLNHEGMIEGAVLLMKKMA